MKQKHVVASCDNDYHRKRPMNNSVACLSLANLCSDLLYIQRVRGGYGSTSRNPWIVDRVNSYIWTMMIITWMYSFLFTKLWVVYYIFIRISVRNKFHHSVLSIRHLFKLWLEGTAHLILLLFLPIPGDWDNLSTMTILKMLTAKYCTITMIAEMTFSIEWQMSLATIYVSNGHTAVESLFMSTLRKRVAATIFTPASTQTLHCAHQEIHIGLDMQAQCTPVALSSKMVIG
jgi:hypothetical protein